MKFDRRDTKIMKGVAICLMICHHLFTFPERLDGVSFISVPFINGMSFAAGAGQFGKLCVALFTMLGGYGAYLSLSRPDADETALTKRHLLSLYSSYWKVFILAVPISLVLGEDGGIPFLENLIYSFLGLRFAYCNEWWFITPFAILTVSSPLVKRFADRKAGDFASSFLLVLLFNAFLYYVLPRLMEAKSLAVFAETFFYTELYTALTLLPAYAMGVLLAKYGVLSAAKALCSGWRRGALTAVSLIVLGALFYIHPFNWLAYDYINAAVFTLCVVALLSSRLGRIAAPVFEKLGEESTYMWLIHTMLCYHWCQKLIYLPKYAPLIFIWLTVLSYAAAKLVRFLYATFGRVTRRIPMSLK